MNDDDVIAWVSPQWHSDWGDPATELDLLKAACVELVRSSQQWELSLCCVEEGYMNVSLRFGDAEIGELMIVDRDKKQRYGVFLTKHIEDLPDEAYFDSGDEVVEFLTQAIGKAGSNGA